MGGAPILSRCMFDSIRGPPGLHGSDVLQELRSTVDSIFALAWAPVNLLSESFTIHFHGCLFLFFSIIGAVLALEAFRHSEVVTDCFPKSLVNGQSRSEEAALEPRFWRIRWHYDLFLSVPGQPDRMKLIHPGCLGVACEPAFVSTCFVDTRIYKYRHIHIHITSYNYISFYMCVHPSPKKKT